MNAPSSISVRPLNSLILIADATGGDIPQWVRGSLILSTPSCISVGCYPEQDGPKKITVGAAGIAPGKGLPAFLGRLATPSRVVRLTTIDDEIILETVVLSTSTPIRIWVNDKRWPDEIIIGVG